jgi:O-succinylbenzoic acid--CoA ligase
MSGPDRRADPRRRPTRGPAVPDPVAEAARRAPGSLAVADGTIRLTWGDLAARVADAAWLLREAGAGRGDRVAVLCGPSSAAVVLVHAARAAGVVLVPLAPGGAAAEVAWQLEHAAPRLLLHDAARAPLALAALAMLQGAIHPPALDLELVAGAGDLHGSAAAAGLHAEGAPLPPLDPAAPGTILYTSGTTGRPKGAILTWANHLASARAWGGVLDPRPDDRWLLALPIHHVAGIGTIVRAAVAGAAVVCAGEGFDARTVVGLIRREGITHLSVVATTLERLLDVLPPGGATGTLRAVLLGGGPWPRDLALRAVAAGLPIVTTYGMTETASGVAALPTVLVAAHPAASGVALAGAVVAVEVDDAPARPGEIGEIVVSGPMVFAGYLDDPEATVVTLRDGRLHTGDLGSLDAAGILTVADRRDDLIISGGENVYPAEVEAILRAHPDVADAAVVGVSDAIWGAVPAAIVALRPGATVDADALRAFARDRLAAPKVPARIVVAAAIPRTAAGKLVRRDLRALVETDPAFREAGAAGTPAPGVAAVPTPPGDGTAPPATPAGGTAAPRPSAEPRAAPLVRRAGALELDGARIAYGRVGSGPGVVLLHATLSRSRAWLPIERRLAARATVVSIDRRGHRASPDPDPMRLAMADHVADVAAVIEQEGLAPALVVGHSFGGCVALELAARRPDLVAGVVAYEPPYLGLAPTDVRDAMARVGLRSGAAHEAGNGPLAAEIFLRAVLGDAGYEALPAGVRAAVLQEGDAAASDARMAGLDPGGLARIRVPVTIAVGSASSPLYRVVADAIAAAVPSARVVVVPEADHMAPVSRPEAIGPIIDGAFDAVFGS